MIPNVPLCVKDYEVEVFAEGEWKRVAEVKDNFMRKQTHEFASLLAEKIRVSVLATWGAPSARVLEIRAELTR